MKFNNSIISKFNSKRTIKYLALFLALFLNLNLNTSCEKGTEPDNVLPGRRDYVWTEDTLYNPPGNVFLTFRHIVGNTADDVWIGTNFSDSPTGLWHYDGFEWQVVQCPIISNTKTALFLFDDNTLLVGNEYNQIIKRENGVWTEKYELKLDEYEKIAIFDIYGLSKDNVFAFGVAVNFETSSNPYKQIGIIFHFDGISWNRVMMPEIAEACLTVKYNKASQKYYIYSLGNEIDNYRDILVEFDGSVAKKSEYTKFGVALSEINGVVYINSDRTVYKLSSDTLSLWKDFSGTEFQTNFVGRNENDFINRSSRGLGHYNGIDYQTIYETDLELQNYEMIGNDIFALGVDYRNQHFVVIHGKLKD